MSGARRGAGLVLVFGESKNDVDAIKHLIEYANPEMKSRVSPRPRPTSLIKGAGRDAVRSWVEAIGDVVDVERRRGSRVEAILVHRDADGPDADQQVHAALARDLATIGATPVVPVQMMEAWWFHFPEATESVRPIAWRNLLPRTARNVDGIDRPKARLMELTRKSYEYAESDSPAIAEAVSKLKAPRLGTSPSFDRLAETAGLLP